MSVHDVIDGQAPDQDHSSVAIGNDVDPVADLDVHAFEVVAGGVDERLAGHAVGFVVAPTTVPSVHVRRAREGADQSCSSRVE